MARYIRTIQFSRSQPNNTTNNGLKELIYRCPSGYTATVFGTARMSYSSDNASNNAYFTLTVMNSTNNNNVFSVQPSSSSAYLVISNNATHTTFPQEIPAIYLSQNEYLNLSSISLANVGQSGLLLARLVAIEESIN